MNVASYGCNPPATLQAGAPSPADGYAITRLDLMEKLIKHPQATLMLRVRCNSMKDTGIMDGSVVLVDKPIQTRNGHVVVACINNEYGAGPLTARASQNNLIRANLIFHDEPIHAIHEHGFLLGSQSLCAMPEPFRREHRTHLLSHSRSNCFANQQAASVRPLVRGFALPHGRCAHRLRS
jgi:DNA polymerase V